MKKIAVVIVCIFLCTSVVFSQSGQSAYKFVNISKPPKPTAPPILTITDVVFSDAKGNNDKFLDANEQGTISFTLLNKGKGTSYNIVVKIEEETGMKGISYTKEIHIDEDLAPMQKRLVEIPVSSNLKLETGKTKFKISVEEVNHFDADPVEIRFNTQSFKNPQLAITDFLFSNNENEGKIKFGEVVNLRVSIKNTGQSTDSNIVATFTNPENVYAGGQVEYKFSTLKPDETQVINYEFFTNKLYTAKDIPIKLAVTENYEKYGTNKTMIISLDKPLPKTPKSRKDGKN